LSATLIIGAGAVGAAALHKCAQRNDELGELWIAARRPARCERAIAEVERLGNRKLAERGLHAAQVEARDPQALAELIRASAARIVLNVASPYCNMAVMDACLATGAHYLDTAVYEVEGADPEPPPWYANHEWKRRGEFERAGVTGILGAGFDPGAVNVFCAWARRHAVEDIETIDIMDVNAGDHGRYFATNFDPETNLREILEDVLYWEDGQWRRIPCHSKSRTFEFPELGEQRVYSMGHDELHSLAAHIPARRIEFWMGFGERYLTCFEVLKNLGLLANRPVEVDGHPVVPIRLLKALLPEPASLAPDYRGKVCIGALVRGRHQGRPRAVLVYTTCDHAECYREIGAQAIAYTTAVPAVTAALLVARGDWDCRRLVNLEELDPDPFMALMPELGLAWQVREEAP